MDAYVIVLRILHIVAGVFWVGSAAVVTFFLEPAAEALGPAAGPFMGEVSVKRRLPIVISVAAIVNVLAGLLLYWEASNGLDPDWIASGPGLAFTVGGIAAIVGLIVGVGFIRPRFARLGAIGDRGPGVGRPALGGADGRGAAPEPGAEAAREDRHVAPCRRGPRDGGRAVPLAA